MKGFWNSKSTIRITLSFIFLFISQFSDVLAAPTRHLCRPEQKDALLKFKTEFEIGKPCRYCTVYCIEPHPKTESWGNNNSDCCNWEGVTCNAKSGEVIELDLSCSYLHGRFHSNSSIRNLHFLTTLDLSFNDFKGQIMSSIENLSHLTYLDLSFNHFSGQVPSSIGNLSHLTFLDLYCNQFSGQVPSSIGNLSHLTTLELSFNRFFGQFPSSIGGLSHLTTLNLFVNNFLGQIPSSIGNLSNLTSLYLCKNNFSGQIPSFIGNLSQLTRLDLSSNNFFGEIPGWLWTLPNLFYVNLSYNTFIGFQRPNKPEPSMGHLLGSNNNFTGKIPSFICELRSLETLDLSDNNFSGLIPRCMGNLKSNLSHLNLRQNNLSGGLPKHIFEILRSLDVGHNQLVGKLPRSLRFFSTLEVLNVESNRINDTFPFWLTSLPKLQVLVLRSNAFHGPIHEASFLKLRIIDISHNHFNGTLPSDYFVKWSAMSSLGTDEDRSNANYMGSVYYQDSMVLMNKGVESELIRILTIYTALDFSGNKFEGEIPKSIGLLKELLVLNLSNNAFTGHIPSSMGKLTALESLDVSQNKLYGEIPQEIGNLSFLSCMNFSHNQLAGLVPGGQQFLTQPCSSFEDNLGLFGSTLEEDCRDIHTPASHQQYKTPETEEEDEEVISWIAAAIGFIPGIVLGLTIGYILVFYKPEWFIKTFGRNNCRRRSTTTTH
ncbi:disease resistance protein-like [Arabidopsis thaliana]|uniref:Receptor-like protein 43 n=2 Tax=Arabidopsis thaliana TaxID=3702 RepID=RLP43_ARATH|nr:receptor like protein 43 [Arabidopsis thaliana]NP_189531.1 receptor like protein 43 [Arabidopsis thaliana]Q9LJW7.1 RecName: Full=Receptor-like protein 43; Short=AtRLP43; Flags: Precursor [Arabidopsis thaliana]AEE77501.1 receptor like protein 43 [Arabidopsis thaliana]AEE77502.1 receptor like protein 43 [Arabidopsis thaliana]VYS58954.1 unnamed protein product [Arabidopsis thaliana]BAB02132.1 disease resistance protein-like [Arabidopsis thaliana]|eukprot:NP_001154652.1 receptor like protein 43 [Arabidopsis thaliana]